MTLTAQDKLERLYMAIALIQDADAGIQTALGDTEECYDLHCGCESLIDDIRDALDTLEANVA
jgi:hypothetical protein